MRRRIFAIGFVFLSLLQGSAVENVFESAEHSVGADIRPSWVIPTNSYLKGDYGAGDIKSAVMPDLRYSFRFSPNTRLGRLYRNVYQGVGLGYLATMPGQSLGHPVNIYVFQGSRIAGLSDRLSLDYEWNFGVSAGWNKYDTDKNPENGAIGSSVNAYLNLGLLLKYRLNDRWSLSAGIEGSHYSNGNTALPNAGINTAGVRVGLSYVLSPSGRQVLPQVESADFEAGIGYDLLAYGAPRQRIINGADDSPMIVPGKFAVFGLSFSPMYAFNRFFRAGVSLDMQYDESVSLQKNLVPETSSDRPLFYRQSFKERFSAGLSLHAELTMPIFSINIGLGRNVIAGSPDTSIFYQTLALKAYVFRNSYINIGYQLRNFKDPNNLMLGVGYTFGRR